MDVDDAFRMAVDQAIGVDTAQNRVARIERHPDIGRGVGQKRLEVRFVLYDRPQMVVVGEFEALSVDIVGHRAETRPKTCPALGIKMRAVFQGNVFLPVDGIARFGDDENAAAHGFQKRQMPLQGVDLGLGVAPQKFAAIPAADQLEPIAAQQGLQHRGVLGEFATQLRSGETDLGNVLQDAVERGIAAQFGHVVIDPGNGADAEGNGHEGSLSVLSFWS